jgi:transportin-3
VTTVTEPLCKCFNSFILTYGAHFIPLLPQLMERLVTAFQQTGLSGYMWVSLKLVREYAKNEGERPCFEFLKSQSQSMFTQMQSENVNNIPDGNH